MNQPHTGHASMEPSSGSEETVEIPVAPEVAAARDARNRRVEDVKTVLRAAKDQAVASAYADFVGELREGVSALETPAPPQGGDDTAIALRTPAAPPAELPTGTPRAVPMQLHQPLDPMYRNLYAQHPNDPEVRQLRNPQIDRDMARWILGYVAKQRSEMIEVEMAYRHMRALDLDLPTGTGHVPEPMANFINLLLQAGSKLRPLCRQFRQGAGTTLKVPTSGIATAVMVAEKGDGSGATGPTPGSILLTKRKMRWEGTATMEFLEDSPFNTVTWFTAAVAEAFGAQEDNQIIGSPGTGANFTDSFSNAATVNDTITGAATYPDVVSLFLSLPERYRGRAVFVGDTSVASVLSNIVDGQGRPIFFPYGGGAIGAGVLTDAAAGGTTATLLGRPFIEVNTVASADELILGVPSEYALLLGMGFQMMTSDHVGWSTDEIAFKAIQRIDGNVMQPAVFRKTASFTAS